MTSSLKREAGYKAIELFVKSNMCIGLGTGSTAAFAVERLGQLLQNGELTNVSAIPTSIATEELMNQWNIPKLDLNNLTNKLDLAIDGADEILISDELWNNNNIENFDGFFQLIKGRGGALLREKMVEVETQKLIIIADSSKVVNSLGMTGAFPVEVVQFGWQKIKSKIEQLDSFQESGGNIIRRKNKDNDDPFITDNNNYILDLYLNSPINAPFIFANELINITGVVEHGLFLNMATDVVVSIDDGIRIIPNNS